MAIKTHPVTVATPCCIRNLVRKTHRKSCSVVGKKKMNNNFFLLLFSTAANQKLYSMIPVRDSEAFTSEKKKLVSTRTFLL